MKSTHVKNETEKIEFPCLMKSLCGKYVILAEKQNNSNSIVGNIVMSKNSVYQLMDRSESFSIDYLQPLPKGEQIILEN